MSAEHDGFFRGLTRHLVNTPFTPTRQTDSGWDLYVRRGSIIKITANFAPAENRISVKITINRGSLGENVYLYDKLKNLHENESNKLLDGDVEWVRKAGKSEAKVQVDQYIDAFESESDRHRWIEAQARLLKPWVDEIV